MRERRTRRTWFHARVCACLAMACTVGNALPPVPAWASELRRTPIVKAAERARPAIVNIHGEKLVGGDRAGSADSQRRVNGMGTGVVIDPRGYIITNHHVVDGVQKITVTLAEKQTYTAKVVSHDPKTDLAIIKIESKETLPTIDIGTSSDLMPGEPVVAVGNAYGYGHTVTWGIISALHRSVQVSDAQNYEDLIQTDASINPGNSGGPLLNIDGEMIGINVAVRAGAQGIGFAIPADKAMAIAAELMSSRRLNNTWHGVVAQESEVPAKGLIIESVEADSPAASSGLKAGDVITSIDDTTIVRALDLERALIAHKAGEKLAVSVNRDDEEVKMDLVLAVLPDALRPVEDPAWEILGLQLEAVSPARFKQLQSSYKVSYKGGLNVTGVRPNSPAAKQGIRRGDVLVGMHVWETISLDNMSYILTRPNLKELEPLKFFVMRGGDTLYGHLTVSHGPTETAASGVAVDQH